MVLDVAVKAAAKAKRREGKKEGAK